MVFVDRRIELLAMGEQEFERMILEYPHEVFLERLEIHVKQDYNKALDVYLEDLNVMFKWLEETCKGSFLPFPTEAIGKHKNRCHSVFFKSESDAVYFKMVWS